MCQDFGRKSLESVYKCVSSRGWRSAPRDLPVGDCVTQATVDANQEQSPFHCASPRPLPRWDYPFTFDRRALINMCDRTCNWEVPRRRAAAEALWRAGGCAARDDPHQNANFTTRRFEVEDFAKHVPN